MISRQLNHASESALAQKPSLKTRVQYGVMRQSREYWNAAKAIDRMTALGGLASDPILRQRRLSLLTHTTFKGKTRN